MVFSYLAVAFCFYNQELCFKIRKWKNKLGLNNEAHFLSSSLYFVFVIVAVLEFFFGTSELGLCSWALKVWSWMEEGPMCPRVAAGSCCPARPPAWLEWVAPAHNLGQQQLCILVPLNHCSDLSSYSFLFLKGLCPGTFLLFSLYFAYKGLLKSWMSCLRLPPYSLLSHLAESFLPASSDGGRSVCVGGGGLGGSPL